MGAAVALLGGLSACQQPAPPVPGKPLVVSTDWVTAYDPERAFDGYTLTLIDRRTPALLDMNGRLVHAWPGVRMKSRVRLLADGSVLGIGMGRRVEEYDWEGRLTWQYRLVGAMPHHDVIRLANGNTLVLSLGRGRGTDTLLEVDRGGRLVWRWEASQHLAAAIARGGSGRHDATHVNSIQELPNNRWFAAGDARLRPGNLLLSARNLNALFIIDRTTGEAVWSFDRGLDMQHEAAMSGLDLPTAGAILLFNNRAGSFTADRQSELLRVDPPTGAVDWSFRTPGFFSPTGGTAQALPNGNTLVTSTRGWRVFEITPGGELVWQWTPPFEPVRAVRVGANACPQLARLSPPVRQPAAALPGVTYVDRDAYRFGRASRFQRLLVEGETRAVLSAESSCADLFLPSGCRLWAQYGVDSLAASHSAAASFVVSVQPLDRPGGTATALPTALFVDRLATRAGNWKEARTELGDWAQRPVRLCLRVEPQAAGYWSPPTISAAGELLQVGEDDGDDMPVDLSSEEREIRREHLEALGYVD